MLPSMRAFPLPRAPLEVLVPSRKCPVRPPRSPSLRAPTARLVLEKTESVVFRVLAPFPSQCHDSHPLGSYGDREPYPAERRGEANLPIAPISLPVAGAQRSTTPRRLGELRLASQMRAHALIKRIVLYGRRLHPDAGSP